MNDFVDDFQERESAIFGPELKSSAPSENALISPSGRELLEGHPVAEIDSIIDSAKSQQKEIGRLRCAAEE